MGGPELAIVAVIAVAVLFGAKKLPEMARSVGRAKGEFSKGLKEGHVDEEPTRSEPAAAAPPAAAPPAVAPAPEQQAPPSTQPPQPPTNGSQA